MTLHVILLRSLRDPFLSHYLKLFFNDLESKQEITASPWYFLIVWSFND